MGSAVSAEANAVPEADAIALRRRPGQGQLQWSSESILRGHTFLVEMSSARAAT